jgi:hypothetical protein
MVQGWFMPVEAAVQVQQQCAVQQIRLDVRCLIAKEKEEVEYSRGRRGRTAAAA